MKKPKRGRPKNPKPTFYLGQRVDEETLDAVKFLAMAWRCSKADALRRALKEMSQLLGNPNFILHDSPDPIMIHFVPNLDMTTYIAIAKEVRVGAKLVFVKPGRLIITQDTPVMALQAFHDRLVFAWDGLRAKIARFMLTIDKIGRIVISLKEQDQLEGEEYPITAAQQIIIFGEASVGIKRSEDRVEFLETNVIPNDSLK